MAIWSLAAVRNGEVGEALYRSYGRWLHPLFNLLDLLAPEGVAEGRASNSALASTGELFVRDRVIGRAAAFLILRAGVRHAWADLLSDGADALFEAHAACLGGAERVPAISCQTEPLLRGVDDMELAWRLLLERRAAARETA
jgi:hypothetical protein